MKTPPSLTAKPVPWEAWAVLLPKKLLIWMTAGRTWASTSRALCEAAGTTALNGPAGGCPCAWTATADSMREAANPAINAERDKAPSNAWCPISRWPRRQVEASARQARNPTSQCWVTALRAKPNLRDLCPHNRCPLAQRLELAERHLARQVLHAAVGRRDQALGRQVLQALADAI